VTETLFDDYAPEPASDCPPAAKGQLVATPIREPRGESVAAYIDE